MSKPSSDRFSPLAPGSKIELEGLSLVLGPAADLPITGFVREGRAADGRAFRVLELPGAELPGPLGQALAVPGVAAAAARLSQDDRQLVALRPAPGPTLEWVLRRGESLGLHGLALVETLCRLFQAIHDSKLVFRSLAPSMFSVAPDGAISLEEPEALRSPSEPPSRAALPFNAPEAVAGSDGGERADQYGLGALCFSLLSGRMPMERGDFPLPRIFRPLLPHGTATALYRALSPRPGDRYESCRAFFADLKERTTPKGASPTGWSVAAATEIGRLKSQSMPVNQDASYIGLDSGSRRGILLVADGVSTADVGSGDLASSLVREAVRSAWEGPVGDILRTHKGPLPQEWAKTALEAILEDANARIYAYLKQPIFVGSLGPGTHPPGSTAVLAILDADRLTVANIGDSRLYLLREGALEAMTVDQDLRTELLKAGRDPRSAADSGTLGALTQSVGSFFFDSEGNVINRPLRAEVQPLFLRAGDRLLFCSDGVPDCLGEGADEVMARELGTGHEAGPIAQRLCQLADEALGADNITALVLLAL
ncbi:MAG: protein phosphatase 2C domain-containing protein [Deltaproteobacteria bacterium]|nr:protein phosphatase 2C domain-containing protein [Deltaproteobacteria bacterium]